MLIETLERNVVKLRNTVIAGLPRNPLQNAPFMGVRVKHRLMRRVIAA